MMMGRSLAAAKYGPVLLAFACLWAPTLLAAENGAVLGNFVKTVRPLLEKNCFDCHGDGEKKGGIAFDDPATPSLAANHELWGKVLKNIRAGLMPPPKKGKLAAEDRQQIEQWVKYDAFGLNPAAPDPGRITLRRLNRVEYRNTIRDLMGVDFKADEEFPPDDTGHGFDNIADVLTISPMLLEKYLSAASGIVSEAVPMTSKVVAERVVKGREFHSTTQPATQPTNEPGAGKPAKVSPDGILPLSYYEPASMAVQVPCEQAGEYRVVLELTVKGKYAEKGFDYNRCAVSFGVDGSELLRQEYGWDQKKELRFEFVQRWDVGEHYFGLALTPTTEGKPHFGELEMQVVSVKVQGPLAKEQWVAPRNYERFFGKSEMASSDPAARHARAGELLSDFASRAFRRPVDAPTVERLVSLAEDVWANSGKSFEAGVAHAMVAVLSSPRFLFLEESSLPLAAGESYPKVDEFSLASRLSYFLWSSMPDPELVRLATAGQLRAHMGEQISRMLADPRSKAFVQNFTGQWLQARDVETMVIESRRVADRQTLSKANLTSDRDERETRAALHEEIQRYFGHVAHEDRSVLELIDSDYTFVNQRLAAYYGIPDITGDEMRRVTLPPESPRGGVLTMGGVLRVTSNPTRTSPVKRGLFVLENILGTPTLPPPPDIPPLEDAGKKFTDHRPTLRETLELHRASSVCSSCHNRMDPLGLAFENFNALGLWRETDATQPINAAGTLITGEPFTNIRELKHILATSRKSDFYRCLTEKMLTYALGRGLDYYDVETVDPIVARLEQTDGRFSSLLRGVIESAPFQRRRISAESSNETSAARVENAEKKVTP